MAYDLTKVPEKDLKMAWEEVFKISEAKFPFEYTLETSKEFYNQPQGLYSKSNTPKRNIANIPTAITFGEGIFKVIVSSVGLCVSSRVSFNATQGKRRRDFSSEGGYMWNEFIKTVSSIGVFLCTWKYPEEKRTLTIGHYVDPKLQEELNKMGEGFDLAKELSKVEEVILNGKKP